MEDGTVQQHTVLTVPGLAGLEQGDPSLLEAVQHLFLSPPPPWLVTCSPALPVFINSCREMARQPGWTRHISMKEKRVDSL